MEPQVSHCRFVEAGPSRCLAKVVEGASPMCWVSLAFDCQSLGQDNRGWITG